MLPTVIKTRCGQMLQNVREKRRQDVLSMWLVSLAAFCSKLRWGQWRQCPTHHSSGPRGRGLIGSGICARVRDPGCEPVRADVRLRYCLPRDRGGSDTVETAGGLEAWEPSVSFLAGDFNLELGMHKEEEGFMDLYGSFCCGNLKADVVSNGKKVDIDHRLS